MAELERIYKDTDTGGWGWVTQEATGGGGSVSDRARYSSVGAVADGDLIEWNPVPAFSDGRPLLAFADPLAPTVLIAGTYAGSVWFESAAQVGKRIRLDFEMVGPGADNAVFENSGALDGIGSQNPTYSVGGFWHLGVGDSMFCAVNHDVGAPYGLYRLYLQLVTED